MVLLQSSHTVFSMVAELMVNARLIFTRPHQKIVFKVEEGRSEEIIVKINT